MNVAQVGQARSRKKCHPWRLVALLQSVMPWHNRDFDPGELLPARGLPVVLRWYVCGRDCKAWVLRNKVDMTYKTYMADMTSLKRIRSSKQNSSGYLDSTQKSFFFTRLDAGRWRPSNVTMMRYPWKGLGRYPRVVSFISDVIDGRFWYHLIPGTRSQH